MTVLSRIRNLEELTVAASLPRTAIDWLAKPIAPSEVTVHTTRKSNGGYRVVCQANDEKLVRLQKRLKEFIDRQVLVAHPSVHGFTRRRGTVTNASAHLGAAALLTVDISNFFPSISRQQVEFALQEHGASETIAAAIANIATFDSALATGFPASPVLSNLVFRPLDDEFEHFANVNGLTYTRYADDLTFSGESVNDAHLGAISAKLSLHGFRTNTKKVRFQRRGHRQIVTGFTVAHADHVRLPKPKKKILRQDLYYSSKIGLAAQASFRNLDEEDFRNQMLGRINYFMSVEPKLARVMRHEFDLLD